MAVEWRERSLGELTENLDSVRVPVKEADRRAGPYPYWGASGIVDYVANYLFEGEYLLIAEDGENLRTRNTPVAFLARGKFWVNNHAHIVRGNGDADTRFLMYALAGTDISGYLTGSTMPKLTQGNMNRIPILAPPVDEQRAIAHILGTLDDKIELNRRMNDTLEAIARALFKSWFVDFDPVRAKSEGRDPGLPPHLADLFPDSLDDSELGEIPQGWHLSRLGNEVETVLGGTPSRAEPRFWKGDIPWINSGKANEFRIIEPTEFITRAGLDSSATKMLPARTTVIAITGATLGQVSVTEIATCANQSIVGVLGSESLPTEFVYYWVRERIHHLIASQTGGAQQHINKNDVNDLRVLCPSNPVIAAYLAWAKPIFDRISTCCVESRTLASLRDGLLPRLVAGEERVTHAQRFVETEA